MERSAAQRADLELYVRWTRAPTPPASAGYRLGHRPVPRPCSQPLLYAEAGIPWYLRIEQKPRVEVVLHRLEQGRYAEQARAHAGEHVESPELGITIEVDALVQRR